MTTIITSKLVGDSQRLSFFPKHFDSLMISIERGIYKVLRTMSSNYNGGF